jgi:hypothetical protein
MDLQKIRVRKDLERMVINYRVTGDITEEQSEKLCFHLEQVIGGGNIPKAGRAEYKNIIQFPTSYTSPRKDNPKDAGIDDHVKDTASEEKQRRVYAPYGEVLPVGIPDFRQLLQRDGLLLIRWEKRTSSEGSYFNVLWARSIIPRYTEWSGKIREESVQYALPLDVDYSKYYHEKTRLVYAVQVAPENVLHGSVADFTAYVESLKNAGMTDASGKQINFDYVYNFAAEKRERWLLRNRELVNLKLSTRVINALNERQITTLKQLKKVTVEELRRVRNIGEQTVQETLALLKQAGITLQEEQAEQKANTV